MVVTNLADDLQNDLDGKVPDPYKHHPAAFVPSKVPRWRTPPHMNILTQEHHITPHMIKVNLMSKFNTLIDQDLSDIEKFPDILTFNHLVRKSEKSENWLWKNFWLWKLFFKKLWFSA